jgi:pre-mRNA-splicing factor SYF2
LLLGLERGEPQPPSVGAGTSDAAEQQPDAENQEDAGADDGYPQMTEKQKKLFELRLKMVW